MKLRPRNRSAVARRSARSSPLNQLLADILGLILRYASETADIGAYADSANSTPRQLDLEHMGKMITARTANITHVCQLWRRIHAPDFYHYAVYDGHARRLLVPEGCEQHIRWLLINVPRDSAPHFNVLRALCGLTPEVRSRVLWLGLYMDNKTAMLVSEYNQLAAAFPALQQVWLDTRRFVDVRAIYLKSAGTKVLPPITSLVLQEDVFRRRDKVASLVHAVAATLTRLELAYTDIGSACEVLWGPGGQVAQYGSRFPQLAKLFISISSVHDGPPTMPLQTTPFPELKVLVCHDSTWPLVGSTTELHGWMRQFVAMLLEHVPAQLRWLSIDDPEGDVPEMLGGKMQQLRTLHLFHNLESCSSSISLQRVLEGAGAIPKLRGLTAISFGAAPLPPLALTCPCHLHLCMLDIDTWHVTLCDLQQLLSKLPRLERLRITLAPSEILPAREDIGQHMAIQWIRIGSDIAADPLWDLESLESLTAMLARMPRLSEALLFSEAMEWLCEETEPRNLEDLQHLARHVHVTCSDPEELYYPEATYPFMRRTR